MRHTRAQIVREALDPTKYDIGADSETGPRDHNEDSYLVDIALGLIVVADGVGGHEAGEVASRITCETLQRESAAGATLSAAILQANRDVVAAVNKGIGKPGMASTVVAARFNESGYELAWVGDSRAYLWSDKLSLLTRDHSYVEAQLAQGLLTIEQAQNHPRKHVILQAIGLHSDDEIEVGTNRGQLAPGDSLFLCSDGIPDTLSSAQLAEVLAVPGTSQECSGHLVQRALRDGGRDNCTAVVVKNMTKNIEPGTRPAAASSNESTVWVFNAKTSAYEGEPNSLVDSGNADNTELMEVIDPLTIQAAQAPQQGAAGSGASAPAGAKRAAIIGLLVGLAAAALAWFALFK